MDSRARSLFRASGFQSKLPFDAASFWYILINLKYRPVVGQLNVPLAE